MGNCGRDHTRARRLRSGFTAVAASCSRPPRGVRWTRRYGPMDLRILGPLEVDEAGRAIPIVGRMQRALLAILLVHANEPVSSDQLIDDLWGEHVPKSARKGLQVQVSRLRKALGD